jgi:hypothetical protein
MTQQSGNEPEDIAVKHKLFEELHSLVDRTLRGLGEPGVTPQDERTIKGSIPPESTARCKWEQFDLTDFYLGNNRLVKIDIAVSPLRIGKNKGRKREEVSVDITCEKAPRGAAAAAGAKPTTMSRKVILTAAYEEAYRDLWVSLPDLKLRWSVFRGYVKWDLGGVFLPASLPPGFVDEVGEKILAYSLMLTITGLIDNLKKLDEMNAGSLGAYIVQL